MEKRQRRELTFEEKKELIEISEGRSQRQLAGIFGVGKTQVACVLKRKAEICDGVSGPSSAPKKPRKRSPSEELDIDKPKRRELNLKEKLELIEQSEGRSHRQLADLFGIGRTQVHSILKRKAEICDSIFGQDSDGARKRPYKPTRMEDLNCLMIEWVQRARASGVKVTGPIIQEQAKLYARDMGIPDEEFKASHGWLNGFRLRYNVSAANLSGESENMPFTAEEWRENLPKIIAGYEPRDVFCLGETGLYYRALPDKKVFEHGEQCKSSENFKDMITVMVCVNMTGEFEKPVVVGTTVTSGSFSSIDVNQLPVTWKHNKKALMTFLLFKEWIKEFNRKMRDAERHVLLILDTAASHSMCMNLSHIKTMFLPANSELKQQPLNHGIFLHIKQIYRKKILRSVLSKIKPNETVSCESLANSVSILDAVQWITASLKEVRSESVMKCFRMARVIKPGFNDMGGLRADNPAEYELRELMRCLQKKLNLGFDMMAPSDYENIDKDLAVSAKLGDSWSSALLDIVLEQKTAGENTEVSNNSGHESHENETEAPGTIRNPQQALECIRALKTFCLKNNLVDAILSLQSAEDIVETRVVKDVRNEKQTNVSLLQGNNQPNVETSSTQQNK